MEKKQMEKKQDSGRYKLEVAVEKTKVVITDSESKEPREITLQEAAVMALNTLDKIEKALNQ